MGIPELLHPAGGTTSNGATQTTSSPGSIPTPNEAEAGPSATTTPGVSQHQAPPGRYHATRACACHLMEMSESRVRETRRHGLLGGRWPNGNPLRDALATRGPTCGTERHAGQPASYLTPNGPAAGA